MELHESAFITDGLTSVEINTNADNIKIVPSEGGMLRFRYQETPKWDYVVRREGEIVRIYKIYHQFNLFNRFQISRLIVEVPVGIALRFNIQNLNARIEISRISLSNSYFETSNAPIDMEKVQLNGTNLDLRTSNAHIKFEKAHNAGNVYLSTSNASIEASDISLDSLYAKSSNAPIKINQIDSNTRIKLSTSNAGIHIKDACAESIEAETVNAGINFNSLDAKLFVIRTNNASITGNIVGKEYDYSYVMRTRNGNCYLNGKKMASAFTSERILEKSVKLITSNGRIDLETY